jgi:hypothetical protein
VKFPRSDDRDTIITLAPLILLWIGFMLQYVPGQRWVVLTIPCPLLEKPARFSSQ